MLNPRKELLLLTGALALSAAIFCITTGCDDASAEIAAGKAVRPPADTTIVEYCGDPAAPTGKADLLARSPSGDYTVRVQAFDQPTPSNEVFSLLVSVSSADGGAPGDLGIRADGAMPHHGHGLAVEPRVSSVEGEASLFRVDGMMLHMPGSWELYIDVVDGPFTERVIFNVQAR